MPGKQQIVSYLVTVAATCESCGEPFVYRHQVALDVIDPADAAARARVEALAHDRLSNAQSRLEGRRFGPGWYLGAWYRGAFERRRGLGMMACPRCGYRQSWMVNVGRADVAQVAALPLAVLSGIAAAITLVWQFVPEIALDVPFIGTLLLALMGATAISALSYGLWMALGFAVLRVVSHPNRGYTRARQLREPVIGEIHIADVAPPALDILYRPGEPASPVVELPGDDSGSTGDIR